MNNITIGSREIWSSDRVKELTMSTIALQNATHEMPQKLQKRPVFKTAVSLASVAAVICLMVLGGTLLFPRDDNVFELKAYALEQQADGSLERREVDLVNETYGWSFNEDGENVYINIWLKCEGENIESVDFYVDEGFFAKQYIIRENGQIVRDGVPMAGSGYTIMRYGDDYVNVGNHFTLHADEMTEDLLVFWGRESRRVGNDLDLPSQLIIRAVATFSDGKTHEEVLALDLSMEKMQGIGAVKLTDDEIAQNRADSLRYDAFIHSIPLDQCEVVPGSERTLTYGDTFEYEIISSSNISGAIPGIAMFPISEESMNPANDESLKQAGYKGLFDENGIARFGSSANLFNLWDEYDGSDGYIAVLETNGDGTFTGKTYIVPGWMILEYME
ncbi:MAG: hypothetical protein FWH57_08020 [Oscillospiraceae bacterium]|nr:hypothetical protein [Oscillospiraceae bacterium]